MGGWVDDGWMHAACHAALHCTHDMSVRSVTHVSHMAVVRCAHEAGRPGWPLTTVPYEYLLLSHCTVLLAVDSVHVRTRKLPPTWNVRTVGRVSMRVPAGNFRPSTASRMAVRHVVGWT